VVRDELIRKIKQFYRISEPVTPAVRAFSPMAPIRALPLRDLAPRVLAIGVSTGGPNALSAMMPMFPADFPYPVLIVQHMPQVFTRLLAERLQKLTTLRVEEATAGCTVEGNKVLIAPGGYHMKVGQAGREVVVLLDQSEARNSCRPSVDVLFESVQATYGGSVVAAVLTGMGQDGLRGTEVLKSAGAFVVAQDEATSVVWGMPGFVVRAGLADTVVPIHDVLPTVLNRFGLHHRATAARRGE
jgi:two-component system chemotaxis response regulator CheB